ncbi:MAG: hypothetical protein K0Q97_1835 [Bacillota bacterium]|nr:hypothetical protein [Bacillota bacterium]
MGRKSKNSKNQKNLDAWLPKNIETMHPMCIIF